MSCHTETRANARSWVPTFCAGFRVFPPNVALQHCADHTFGRIADKTDDNATALALVLTIARGWICDQNLMGRAAQSGSNATHCSPKLTYVRGRSQRGLTYSLRVVRTCCEGWHHCHWENGAVLLAPLTQEQAVEVGLELRAHHVVIAQLDQSRLETALAAIRCRRRPQVHE